MPAGVIFFVCIPTLNYEHELVFGRSARLTPEKRTAKSSNFKLHLKPAKVEPRLLPLTVIGGDNDDDSGGTIGGDLRHFDKRDILHSDYGDDEDDGYSVFNDDSDYTKGIYHRKNRFINKQINGADDTHFRKEYSGRKRIRDRGDGKIFVPMETVLHELLKKLRVEHVVWCKDQDNLYYEVIFPVPAGDPCENCLHCLTEIGIGVRMNSIVSVIPTQCTYSSLEDTKPPLNKQKADRKASSERNNAWATFVSSIRSKLTVKQVVDGVRSGGDLTFDYIALVLTADCLAALGLVENSATNVVAAMLVSPLMGPVMSLTFGTIIADRQLQCVGLKSLTLGMFLSILFGFIFGLILGSTEMPWGYNDWPTDEMKGRGNYRSLWMGVLWALPSGTGVAIALLQGISGPLIGVAISASLLPPVVNCGLFWALGCIWLIRRPIKMLHMKGESYVRLNTTYKYIYTSYLPVEFFCNGIISACLTVVNVVCIFITAIIVLKIKEVAAPYTSTPELRRFWEHDIRYVRNKNVNRNENSVDSSFYEDLSETKKQALEQTLTAAILEAMNDETFRNVRRFSYGQHSQNENWSNLGLSTADLKANISDQAGEKDSQNINKTDNQPTRFTGKTEDLEVLDKLIPLLLNPSPNEPSGNNGDLWHSLRRSTANGYQQLHSNDGTNLKDILIDSNKSGI